MSSRKEQDLARLSKGFAPPPAPPVAPPLAPPLAPPPAPSDYTSFPYLPTQTTKPTNLQADFSSSFEEGKGKAGEDEQVKPKAKVILFKSKSVPSKNPVQQVAEPSAQMTEDEYIKAVIAKKSVKDVLKDEALYPVVHGPHEPFIRHPSKQFENWSGFSEVVRKKLYLKYRDEYVPNWYAGKKGKAFKAEQALDDELVLDLDNIDYEANFAVPKGS
jgi:hypothetical protein